MRWGELEVGVVGLGLALLGTLLFLLGLAGELYGAFLAASFLLALAATAAVLRVVRGLDPGPRPRDPSLWPRLLLLALCTLIFLLGQLPPVAKDALVQHLALPRVFLNEHSIAELPTASFSWYPMMVDLLYLLPLSFGNDTLPAAIHALFGLLTARLLFVYLSTEFDSRWAWLGVFLFLSVPVIFFLSTVAYVDLALVFFSFLALVALQRWRDAAKQGREATPWFVLSALAVGAAMATKYNGYILLPFALAGCAWISSRVHGEGGGQILKRVVWYTVCGMPFAAPWLLRNLVKQGNPVYPLLSGFWGGSLGAAGVPPLLLRHELYHEGWLEVLALPVRMFFWGEDNQPARFDGRLNPMLLILPLLALIAWLPRASRVGLKKQEPIFVGFCLTYLAFALVGGAGRVRYLSPLVAPLIVLGIGGLVRVQSIPAARWVTASAAGITLLLNGIYVADYTHRLDPWPYLAGREPRDVYLARHLSDYPVYRYVNVHLPKQAKVMLLFMGNRGYYCERDYLYDSPIDGKTLVEIVERARSTEEIAGGLRRMGITHIAMNRPLAVDYLSRRLQTERWELFQQFARGRLKMLYAEGPFYLFEV